MLRTSSSTTSTLRPARTGSSRWPCSIMRRFCSGSFAWTRWRKRAVSSSNRSGERTFLITIESEIIRSSVSSWRESSLPV